MSTSLQDNDAVQPSTEATISPWTVTVNAMERTSWHNGSFREPNIEDFEIATKWQQYFLVVLYSMTAAIALLGNVLAIVVLMRGKRSSRDLRLFLVNLSLSDIIMSSFSIPFTYTNFILGRWIFWPETCPVVQSMQVLAVFVSIYTLTIIGVDRYIAITRPFIKSLWSKSFAPIIVALTWLIGFMLCLVIWFSSKAEHLITIDNVTYYDCRENWSNKRQEQIYTVSLFLVVFAIPLLILIFVYGSISLKLWSHSAPGNANAIRDGVQSQAKIKVIKMLITIVVLFAICWLPVHLFQLVRVFNQEFLNHFIDYDASNVRYLIIVICSHWLSMANSFVNPIIYCFMSDNFRIDLKDIAKRCLKPPRWCHQVNTLSPTSLVIEQLHDIDNSNCRNSGRVVCYPMMVRNGGSQANTSIGQRDHRNGINVKFKIRQDNDKCHCKAITKEQHKKRTKRCRSSISSSNEISCTSSGSKSNVTLNSYSPSMVGSNQINQLGPPNGRELLDHMKSIAETKT